MSPAEEVITVKVLRLLIGVGAVVAVACLASVTWGADRPDDRAGPIGVGATLVSEQLPYDAYGTADTVEARIRLGLDARGDALFAERPDDHAGQLGVGAIEPGTYPAPATTTGTEWDDPVVVGALLALVALVALAGVIVVTRHRHGGTGTTGPGTPAATH